VRLLIPNILSVIVASICSMVIGFAWYSPMLFSKQWMKVNNIDFAKMKKANQAMAKMYSLTAVAWFVTSFVLGWFIKQSSQTGMTNGAMIGFIAWLGFATTTQLVNWIYSGKVKEAYLIDTGYQLVSFVAMGAILGAWQ
jgi:preprotein translocase subunit SecG